MRQNPEPERLEENFKRGRSIMKCMKCGKEAFAGTTEESVETGFDVLVIRNIPCFKCAECNEIFYTGNVAEKIEKRSERVRQTAQKAAAVEFE